MEQRQGPVFVKLDDYKEIMEVIDLIRGKIVETRHLIDRMHQLKADEDAEIGMWRSEVEELEKRIQLIDHSMLEPQ